MLPSSSLTNSESDKTFSESLAHAAEDKHWDVRRYVAGNPLTPPEVLAKLAADENVYVVRHITENPSVSGNILATLAAHPERQVRVLVAQHVNVFGQTLFKLAHDKEPAVRWYAKCRPKLYHYLQTKAVQDGICEAGQQMPVEWLKEMYLE